MSIINEALKKAGQPVIAETKKDSELLPARGGSAFGGKKRGRINWGPLFVVAILILVTAPILAPILQDHSGGAPAPSTVQRQFAIEETPLVPASPRPSLMGARVPNFSLSGLIYSTGGSYCLINGKVVKVGDSVNGATLVDVTPSAAVLDYRGEKITLPANT